MTDFISNGANILEPTMLVNQVSIAFKDVAIVSNIQGTTRIYCRLI